MVRKDLDWFFNPLELQPANWKFRREVWPSAGAEFAWKWPPLQYTPPTREGETTWLCFDWRKISTPAPRSKPSSWPPATHPTMPPWRSPDGGGFPRAGPYPMTCCTSAWSTYRGRPVRRSTCAICTTRPCVCCTTPRRELATGTPADRPPTRGSWWAWPASSSEAVPGQPPMATKGSPSWANGSGRMPICKRTRQRSGGFYLKPKT